MTRTVLYLLTMIDTLSDEEHNNTSPTTTC
jgi:hypothetical protein